ncbi:hypothetical protein RRG08_002635 [Elysia crispata]|uniref:Methyltransferase domain-containing protein n=1 Tax=Elysia crispata TaxID=231223 RepID=A0AAE0Y4W3_9GAST|nr:hypothetical protein RRG08_002635 [Elysia crispata]
MIRNILSRFYPETERPAEAMRVVPLSQWRSLLSTLNSKVDKCVLHTTITISGTRNVNSSTMTDLSTLYVDWDTSRKYAQHRHRYSPQVFRIISDYCRQAGNDLDLAVDIGCGPGNSTVLGIDSSHTQIEFAPKHIPNCDFKVASAHDLQFIHEETVDMVCSGMAFNLMPSDKTLTEVKRILKPGGTFAIFGHGPPRCSDERMERFVNAAVSDLKPRILREFSPILNNYKNVEHPYPEAIRVPDVVVRHSMSLSGVLSVYEFMQRVLSEYANPQDTHGTFLKDVKSRVTDFFPDIGDEAEDPSFEFLFDIVILLGSKPGH